MSYPLEQTHHWLQKCFQVKEADAADEKSNDELFALAWKEILNFQASFLQSAAASPSAESLRILVDITATACVDSMNTLTLMLQQTGIPAKGQSERSRFIFFLEESLSWLGKRFGNYLNENLGMPDHFAAKEQLALRQVLSEKWGKTGVQEEWLALLLNLVKETFENQGASPSYRQVSYIRRLVNAIHEISAVSPADAVLDDFTKLLIRYNCNDASVIQQITQKVRAEANDSLSPAGRIEKWQWLGKAIRQIAESGMALRPGAASVKAFLLSFVNAEITWLSQKEQSLSAVYGSRLSSASGSAAFTPLLTTLSVSQLAVWCRLLSGCGIVKHDNQTELLKTIAGALQTTRAANISADSLRAKYYSPDRAALAVVKEHLFQMINLVKDM